MKRLHVHIAVDDLPKSIGFYSALFAQAPSVEKPDYAKWALDDPRVNFAISMRGRKAGLDHLGIQVEDEAELAEMQSRLTRAQLPITSQQATACCYAKSDKHWTVDPQGIAWESFRSLSTVPVYGEDLAANEAEASACCVEASCATTVKTEIAQQEACCTPKAACG